MHHICQVTRWLILTIICCSLKQRVAVEAQDQALLFGNPQEWTYQANINHNPFAIHDSNLPVQNPVLQQNQFANPELQQAFQTHSINQGTRNPGLSPRGPVYNLVAAHGDVGVPKPVIASQSYEIYEDAPSEEDSNNNTSHNSQKYYHNETLHANNDEYSGETFSSTSAPPSDDSDKPTIYTDDNQDSNGTIIYDDSYEDFENELINATSIKPQEFSASQKIVHNDTYYNYDDYDPNETNNSTKIHDGNRLGKQLNHRNTSEEPSTTTQAPDIHVDYDYDHFDNATEATNETTLATISSRHNQNDIEQKISNQIYFENDKTSSENTNTLEDSTITSKQPRKNSKMQSTLAETDDTTKEQTSPTSTAENKETTPATVSTTSTEAPSTAIVKVSRVETHVKVSVHKETEEVTTDSGKEESRDADYYDDDEEEHDVPPTVEPTTSTTTSTQAPTTTTTSTTSRPSTTIPTTAAPPTTTTTIKPLKTTTTTPSTTTTTTPSTTTTTTTTTTTPKPTVKVITHKPIKPILEIPPKEEKVEAINPTTLQPIYVPSTPKTTTTLKPKTTPVSKNAPTINQKPKITPIRTTTEEVKTKLLYKPVNQFGFTVEAPFEIPAHLLPETTTTTLQPAHSTPTTTARPSSTSPAPTISSKPKVNNESIADKEKHPVETSQPKDHLPETNPLPASPETVPKIRPARPHFAGLPPSIINKYKPAADARPGLRPFPKTRPLAEPNPNEQPPPEEDGDIPQGRAALGWEPTYHRKIFIEDLPRGSSSTEKPSWGLSFGKPSTSRPWLQPGAVADTPTHHRPQQTFTRKTTTTTRKPPWLYPEEESTDFISQKQPDANVPIGGAGAPLSSSTKSTLILCAVFAGAAAMFFASVMVFCMIRQKRKRLIRRRQLMNKLILETGSEASSYGSYGSKNEARPFASRLR